MKRLQKTIKISIIFCIVILLACCASTKMTDVPTTDADKTTQSKFDKDLFLDEVKKIALTGNYSEAIEKINNVPAKYKNDFDINLFKAKLYDVSGDYETALVLFTELSVKNPNNKELSDLLVALDKKIFMTKLQVSLAKNDFNTALSLFDTLNEETMKEFDIIFLKASILASSGSLDEAQKLCNSLLKQEPDNIDVLDLAATIARMKGDNKTKTAYINQIIKKDPYNVDANIALAENSMSTKNYTVAQQYYKRALSKEKDNVDVLLGVAITQYFLEQDEACESTLKRIVELDSDYPQAYYYLAKLAEANNESKVAVDMIEKAIQCDENNYNYYLDYGMYLRNIGKFDDAEKAWTKAISIDDSYFLAYACRAGIYEEREDYKKAIEDYKTVVRINPKYYYSYESLGILALREKDWTTARESFMKCRESNASNISYPLLVTYCYYMEGNSVEAKKYSESVYRKLNNSSMEYKMLRAYHDQSGYQNLSLEIAKMSGTQERGKMYFYLGLLYSMFGGTEKAKEYYTHVLSMNSAMFFEYRLAEWSVEIENAE